MAADAETKTATDQQFIIKIPTNDIIISSDVWYNYKFVFFQFIFSTKFLIEELEF